MKDIIIKSMEEQDIKDVAVILTDSWKIAYKDIIDKDYLENLKEEERIEKVKKEYKDGSYIASPLDGAVPFEITLNTPVSMNFFAFQKDVLEILEEYWQDFFNQDTEVLFTKEALLPECINAYLHKKRLRLINCPTKGKWMGMTYKRDLDEVKKEIKALQEKGKYKVNLWG